MHSSDRGTSYFALPAKRRTLQGIAGSTLRSGQDSGNSKDQDDFGQKKASQAEETRKVCRSPPITPASHIQHAPSTPSLSHRPRPPIASLSLRHRPWIPQILLSDPTAATSGPRDWKGRKRRLEERPPAERLAALYKAPQPARPKEGSSRSPSRSPVRARASKSALPKRPPSAKDQALPPRGASFTSQPPGPSLAGLLSGSGSGAREEAYQPVSQGPDSAVILRTSSR